MTRHENERLWALAADELELDDRRFVELHLQDCPECRDSLDAVRVARRALESARRSSPALDWSDTDERVGSLVERRLRANARPRWFGWAGAGGALALATGLAVLLSPTAPQPEVEPPPTEPPLVQSTSPRPIRVELARSLTRVSASSEAVAAGETLKGGDVLRTGVAGKAFVHLPDASHMRIAASTQVALTRTEADDVALTLTRGRVAVRASHEPRRAFVVHAGDVAVHVVGTVFSVANGADGVEVAVSEGEVKVGSGESSTTLVRAGQRLSFDVKGRPRLGRLTPGLERELGEVQGLAEAVSSAEQQQAVVAARGGRVETPKPGGPLPRLSEAEAKARQVEPLSPGPAAGEPSAKPEAQPLVQEPEHHDGPGTAFPSLAGGYTRGVPSSRDDLELPAKPEGPVGDEADWAALPKAQPPPTLIVPVLEAKPEVKPAPKLEAAPEPRRAASRSLEEVFLEKAAASLGAGGCERYLPGLEDMAIEAGDSAQLARVLRARCFEAQLRPRQAMSEYTKYLEAWPKGRFVDEARTALGQ